VRPAVLAVPLAAALLLPSTALAGKTVELGDNYMIEDLGVPRMSIKAGTKVTFVWTGKRRHNVTAVDAGEPLFGSPTQRMGTWTHRFKRAGTVDFICTVHGAGDMGMILKVR